MAGIQEYLDKIKNAVYGREVRQAIHDGIEQCYKDGKAGAVDLEARQRIDEFTHLAEGSTTGDAELIDGRTVGGETFTNIGGAIRGVNDSSDNKFITLINSISSDIDPLSVQFRYGNSAMTMIKSSLIPVEEGYTLFNSIPQINTSWVRFNFYEYDESKAQIGTAKYFWGLRKYTSTTSNVKYVEVRVTVGTNEAISTDTLNALSDTVKLYQAPPFTERGDDTVIKDVFIYGVWSESDSPTAIMPYYSGMAQRFFSSHLYSTANVERITNLYPNKYDFWLLYYDENYSLLSQGSWHTNWTDIENTNASYFAIGVRGHDNASVDPEDVIADLENGCFTKNQFFVYGSLDSSGNYMGTGNNRMVSDFAEVSDGYVILNNHNYDYMIYLYDANKTFIKYTPWQSFKADASYETIDSFPVKDGYVRVIIAKQDHSANMNGDDIKAFGTLFSVYEKTLEDEALLDNYYGYPTYYEDEINATIKSVGENTDLDSVNFVMITDLHNNGETASQFLRSQIESIRKIKDSCKLDFVVLGGDISDGLYADKDKCLDNYTKVVNRFNHIGVPILALRGNHDDNSYQGSNAVDKIVSRKDYYRRVISVLADNVMSDNYTYYHHDFGSTRVICLDYLDYPDTIVEGSYQYVARGGAWRGYSDDQVRWFCELLQNTDHEKVIVASHYSTNSKLMLETQGGVVDRNAENISSAMIAYNNRSTFSFGGRTYDFSSKTGKILIQISGHSHAFGAFKEDGIVWSTTGSPSPEVTRRVFDDSQYETMSSRPYFTSDEPHFNVFCVKENKVNVISFGAMGDKEFDL